MHAVQLCMWLHIANTKYVQNIWIVDTGISLRITPQMNDSHKISWLVQGCTHVHVAS